MSDDNQSPGFDASKVTFPTDAVTLGTIRSQNPEVFSTEGLLKCHLSDLEITGTVHLELTAAEQAYAAAAGLPDPHSGTDDPQEVIEMLERGYCELGIASGIEQSRQLVRNLQSQAANQAPKRPKMGRG